MSTAESNVESDARLATNQELIWLGQRLQADVPLFEVPYLYTIRGTIEPDVLSAAFKDLIHANETLRTVSADRQWSRARCAQRTNFRCEAIDLSTHVDPEAAAQSFVDAQLGEAFDPTESLCRATLMGVGPDHWKLLVVIHHALTDALCGRALLKNLAAFYEARQAGSANPVAHGYQRFLDRESETLVDADWWAERSNHRVDSRFYRAIAAPGSNRHTRIVHASAELDESIRMLSGTKPFRQITPALGHFNVLATALTSWLYRLSPRGAVSIGATAHGRSTPEFRDTIGLFMQLLPFRVPTDAEDIFESVSRKIATESMGFLQHSMPGRMTAASQRAFDVVLNVIDLSVDDFCGMPTSMEWLHNGYGEPDRKLCLSAHLRGGSWELLFDFNDDAFDPQERQRAIEHFTGTLRSMATQPKALIRDYSLLTSEESRRLSALNATADPTPSASRSGTAWERFREHASDQLDDTAIVCAASQLKYTYEELLERAQATARQIACADVGPLVPLVCRRNAHAVVGALGVLASGRCFLPIDADLPRSRIETLLEQAGSTQLVDVTTETFSVRKSGIVSPSVCPLTENACYTLFTSGSTGLPSGVVVGDDSILNLLKEFERLGPLGSRARCGWWTNVGFDVAIYEVFSAILYGRELHIPAESTRTQADAMVEWLNSTLIESIYLPPYFLSRLGQRIREYGATSLRRLLVGVEPIPQELLASIAESSPELHLINGYGPTEATVCATLELIDPDEKSTGPASIGFPVRGNRLRIIDENGVDAPPGVPGELWIGGGGLAKGYLGDPAKTRNRFVRHDDHDWYRSGDRVRLGEDDKLTFLGRCDDQLKISGVRIEPAEVAATIRELEDVSECVVLPLEREGHPVGLAAFLETTREINEPSLRSELRERLPRAMVPARMVSVD
ncbi:MAG: AMP-binding protein, partial [Planctomycetota bacterium]